MAGSATTWRRCSSCKKDIGFRSTYWVCSVSTCNRPRTGLAFCSTSCWDVHLPIVRHRESWAVEATAPSREEAAAERAVSTSAGGASSAERTPRRILARPATGTARDPVSADILVVTSKVKEYVRARSEMNTSDRVMEVLSEHLRVLCDRSIEAARAEGRKTVLERDVPRPPWE